VQLTSDSTHQAQNVVTDADGSYDGDTGLGLDDFASIDASDFNVH
jgi:hypothetical protein